MTNVNRGSWVLLSWNQNSKTFRLRIILERDSEWNFSQWKNWESVPEQDTQIQVATRVATLSSEAKRLIFMEAFGFNLKAWGFAYHNSPPSDIAIAAIQKCLLGQTTWMGKKPPNIM